MSRVGSQETPGFSQFTTLWVFTALCRYLLIIAVVLRLVSWLAFARVDSHINDRNSLNIREVIAEHGDLQTIPRSLRGVLQRS